MQGSRTPHGEPTSGAREWSSAHPPPSASSSSSARASSPTLSDLAFFARAVRNGLRRWCTPRIKFALVILFLRSSLLLLALRLRRGDEALSGAYSSLSTPSPDDTPPAIRAAGPPQGNPHTPILLIHGLSARRPRYAPPAPGTDLSRGTSRPRHLSIVLAVRCAHRAEGLHQPSLLSSPPFFDTKKRERKKGKDAQMRNNHQKARAVSGGEVPPHARDLRDGLHRVVIAVRQNVFNPLREGKGREEKKGGEALGGQLAWLERLQEEKSREERMEIDGGSVAQQFFGKHISSNAADVPKS
ncbi:hypothetical protein K438DRAFT_1936879 [Mycena galopus ATCC 62051]|nr:hypothetical protein K438DRAFT_1936879 [Mycena galopus ATCC 62051]